tara:strand:- start:670 stop:987 length:318 start_codon:yes stop_codon:yes gene_type:complete
MLISVKYHGATNHRGSKFIATMESPSGSGSDSIRCSAPFDYSNDKSGGLKAAEKVIAKWESIANLDRSKYPGSWSVECIGSTHNYATIFKPTWTYDGDKQQPQES